jgi:surface protein
MKRWDVSNITDMSGLFQWSGLNEPIRCWNVSKVTTMDSMFYGATAFNQAIGNWNVSKVTDMSYMFRQTGSFNQDLCAWYNKWKNDTIVSDTKTDDFFGNTNTIGMFYFSGCSYKTIPNFASKTSFCQACTCSGSKLSLIVLEMSVVQFFAYYYLIANILLIALQYRHNAVTARKHAVQMLNATALACSARKGNVLLKFIRQPPYLRQLNGL